jgi:hypothetical protein
MRDSVVLGMIVRKGGSVGGGSGRAGRASGRVGRGGGTWGWIVGFSHGDRDINRRGDDNPVGGSRGRRWQRRVFVICLLRIISRKKFQGDPLPVHVAQNIFLLVRCIPGEHGGLHVAERLLRHAEEARGHTRRHHHHVRGHHSWHSPIHHSLWHTQRN